jgi:hypothetical protein
LEQVGRDCKKGEKQKEEYVVGGFRVSIVSRTTERW